MKKLGTCKYQTFKRLIQAVFSKSWQFLLLRGEYQKVSVLVLL